LPPFISGFLHVYLPALYLKTLNVKICKTVISPVDSDGCGTWPLVLLAEHRTKNKAQTRIFGPKNK
jgi:hypothetical protein